MTTTDGEGAGGRLAPLLGTTAFFLLAPGTVAGLVPYWLTGWRTGPPLPGGQAGRAAGAALLAAGLGVLLDSFLRFAWQGRGTPAPIAPTRTLVVSGLYRHVRNPMYLAVLSIVLGQAALFGSRALLAYAAGLFAAFHAFVRLYEEPTLRARHGAGYDAYCRAVDRWRPRARAWAPGLESRR